LQIDSSLRTFGAVGLTLALAAACTTLLSARGRMPLAAMGAASRAGGASVGVEVYERLAGGGKVRVLVFLRLPEEATGRSGHGTSASPGGGPTRSLLDRVAAVQDGALTALAPADFTLARRFRTVPAFAGEISAAGVAALTARPEVDRIDLDVGGHVDLAEVVPLIKADVVHALGYTGQGVTVALLDSGIDTDHPDLGDDLIAQACFCSGGTGCCPDGSTTQFGNGAAEDDNGHGSGVAGVITSNGVVSPPGVAPKAKLVLVKVVDSTGAFCCTSDVIAGLDWVNANRPDVKIVNMSLGTTIQFGGDCDNARSFTRAFAASINSLRARGVTTFASAGNDGSGTAMEAPACVANVVSAGAVYDSDVGPVTAHGCTDATTAADQVTCFSNSDASTDLFAPGAPTTSDGLAGGTNNYYGTSFASPAAAACAADLLQAYPSLTPSRIETAVRTSAVHVTAPRNGLTFPRLDCLAALQSLATVTGLLVSGDPTTLSWDASPYATSGYDVYRGDFAEIRAAGTLVTHRLDCHSAATTFDISTDDPATDDGFIYIVAPHGEVPGSPGEDSQGTPRALNDPCP